ncbi:MAG: DUF1028 domain-containing protein [Actinomycetota bacterium]
MTFSIVASDPERGDWGVAVASKFPAVGAVVPYARAGAGAVATQAWANVAFGPDGLAMLAGGGVANDVVEALIQGDDGRDQRQVGVVDSSGSSATFTGRRCMPWAGGVMEDGVACQGNILTGPEVVEAMIRRFREADGELADHLLAALEAGDEAGGDRRGKQSAALLVVRAGGGYEGRSDRYVDLRVDDHPDPVRELRRIFTIYDEQFLVRNDPLLPVTPVLTEELQRRLRQTGHFTGDVSGSYDDGTREAISAFAGEFNLEGRLRTDDLLSEALVREIRDVTPEVG